MIEPLLIKIIGIYSWITASFIMIFVIAIAIYYQKKFGVKTFYYLYFVPLILLFIAVLHIFSYQSLLFELLEFLGSLTSFLASFYLYRLMVGVK